MEKKPVDKLMKARVQMILSKTTAFFASLMMKRKFIINDKIKTARTDGNVVEYASKFLDAMTIPEIITVICHELMHITLGHHLRRGNRDIRLWNIACDYAVNIILHDAGMKIPECGLLDRKYRSMSAEAIYNILLDEEKQKQKQQQEQQNDDNSNSGGGKSPDSDEGGKGNEDVDDGGEEADKGQDGEDGDGDSDEGEDVDDSDSNDSNDDSEQDEEDDDDNGGGEDDGKDEAEIDDTDPGGMGGVTDAPIQLDESDIQEQEGMLRQELSQAIMIAKQQGADIPDCIERLIAELVDPAVNWHEVLARFLSETAKSDYSFTKPNMRYAATGFGLPSLHNQEVGNIVLVVDTSGSINEKLLGIFASEIGEIASMLNCPLRVIHVDTRVRHDETFEVGEDVEINPQGGGGTNFCPAFDLLSEEDTEPTALVYFTDGECSSFPHAEPDYPVLWATYSNYGYSDFKPPFGEVVRVEDKEEN
jgi:predicted metal-dependent peptidase